MQAWQKREQEVDAYVAAGELDVHDNADEFLAHLGAIDAHRVDGSDSRRRDDQP
ncbi:hypothetical protein [Nocardioides sp.]|uniref:hypothetical protein n=2 Tax=unclassified Nocardioides TaxID=2615069 RepID=UPI0019C11693|nr:hypothetical protein [Nocardioides sp.]MBC7277385.1 hypothetical protein [Nocardioides sp.]